ncbi:MAG TPA: PAS domain S-box protein [Polyangia bacterium]|nr:PAS domain S-box protein [Polyangia bacterium]
MAEVEARPAELIAILDGSSEALVAFGADRRIVHANARAAAMFGYEPAQLAGRSTDLLIPERLRQPDAPPMMATVDLMQVELPGLMRDGRELAVEWCFGSARRAATPIFVMTVRDRVELDRALEELRVSEERFRLLVDGVRDYAIFMLDADARVSSWNQGAARIKGWETAEILGQPYEVFFTPEDRVAGVPAALIASVTKEGALDTTGWRVRKDGTRFWAHASLTAIRDADGEIRGFAKVTRDLTERRRAEENERNLIIERTAREAAQEAEQRLRVSEEKLRGLQRLTASLSDSLSPEQVSKVILGAFLEALDASTCTVYLLAPDGKALELFDQRGFASKTLASYRSVPLDARTPVADAARAREALYFESQESCLEAYPALRQSVGPNEFGSAIALPLVADGVLVGALGLRFAYERRFDGGDRALITTMGELCSQALERSRLFKAESVARASAESASRSKDEFLAMLSHELRNPLAPIRTAVQLMKLRDSGQSVREREIIERQVAHLSGLVDDLLDVSRVARGQISLSRVPTAVSDVLARAVEMVSPLFEQRAHHLAISVAQPNLTVNADPLRLAQVLANLLSNAAKYTPPHGHVWLTAALEGDDVVVRVRDDGEGISPELLPRVFEMFVQGSRTAARSEGGLGLGLALVKSFVALHEGSVVATSDGLGKGSEFVVRIPAIRDTAATATPPRSDLADGTARARRILVVDDNEDARELLAELLRSLGHEVAVAEDGPTALEQLRAFSAEVAILDLGLPVMDGFELARRVRDQQGAAAPRLIALTGYGLDRDLLQSRAAGFAVHLVKPVDAADLVAAIESTG